MEFELEELYIPMFVFALIIAIIGMVGIKYIEAQVIEECFKYNPNNGQVCLELK